MITVNRPVPQRTLTSLDDVIVEGVSTTDGAAKYSPVGCIMYSRQALIGL